MGQEDAKVVEMSARLCAEWLRSSVTTRESLTARVHFQEQEKDREGEGEGQEEQAVQEEAEELESLEREKGTWERRTARAEEGSEEAGIEARALRMEAAELKRKSQEREEDPQTYEEQEKGKLRKLGAEEPPVAPEGATREVDDESELTSGQGVCAWMGPLSGWKRGQLVELNDRHCILSLHGEEEVLPRAAFIRLIRSRSVLLTS